MKFKVIASILCIAPMALADEVLLNDGTVYKDCIVENETDKDVTIVIQVSKTIRDSKVIPKAQIQSIRKSSPDERQYAELVRKYGEVETLTPDEVMKGVELTQKFISENEKSKLVDKAKELEARLTKVMEQKEQEQAAEAENQEDEVQVSPEEMKRRGYDIEAEKILKKYKEKIKQKNVFAAMLYFDELSQKFNASEAYREARESAAKVLPQVEANLGKMAAQAEAKDQEAVKAEAKRRQEFSTQKRSPNINAEQRKAIEDAETRWREEIAKKREQRDQRRTQYMEKIRELRDKNMRWFNPITDMPESLRELERVAKTDAEKIKRELQSPDSDRAGKGSDELKKAWKALDEGQLDDASKALSEVRGARVPREYWETLDIEIKAAKTAAYEKARAERDAERAKLLEERRKKMDERRKNTMKDVNEKFKDMKDKK